MDLEKFHEKTPDFGCFSEEFRMAEFRETEILTKSIKFNMSGVKWS